MMLIIKTLPKKYLWLFLKALMQFSIKILRFLKRIIIEFLSLISFKLGISYKNKVSVFLFHEVSNFPSEFSIQNKLNVDLNTFKTQINWIQKRFNIIHPSMLLNAEFIPDRSAIISFDDGMLSVFDYALPYLKDNNIPSVMFLNMSHIVNSTPLISAEVLFLDKSGHLTKFMKEKNITPPAYLNISPQQLIEFRSAQETYYMEQIQAYQGPLATLETIKKWNDSKLIVYGNHLYEHWNSTALTEKEFVDSIRNNSKSLSELNNYIEFFAFPNGQPMSCFTNEYVKLLHNLGLKKVFYSSGGVNSNKNNFLINRIALFEDDNTPYKLFRRFISVSSNKLIQVDTGFNLDKG